MRKNEKRGAEVPSESDKDWMKANGPSISVFWLADTRLQFATWLAAEGHQYYDKMVEFEAATLRCLSAKDLMYWLNDLKLPETVKKYCP